MSVNYELYKYFYYVAKLSSVSKASETLDVTQSAVSQAIKQLERQLDKKLFIRTSRGMKLTKTGEILYFYVRNGARYFIEAETKLNAPSEDDLKQTIIVATTPILAKHFLINKLDMITQCGVSIVEIKEFHGFNERVDSVLEGFANFAIVKDTKNYTNEKLNIVKIGELNYAFFYNPQFFDIGIINIEELANYPLILKDNISETGKTFIKTFGNQLKAKFITQHDDLIIDLVRQGLGIGFAPKEYLTKEFKIIDIKDYLGFKFDIKLVHLNLDKQIVKIFNDLSNTNI